VEIATVIAAQIVAIRDYNAAAEAVTPRIIRDNTVLEDRREVLNEDALAAAIPTDGAVADG
jgi:hypothetical protein